jgi:AhpD family alkylhydroperoxidase
VGLIGWTVAQVSGRVAGTPPPNLFLTLGRHRALFRGWLRFAGRLMPGGKLPRRETELVILRVAHLRDCRYEFDHHRHLAVRAGVTPSDIAAITSVTADPAGPTWSDRERVVVATVDALVARHDLDDDEWGRLRAHLTEREVIELVLLIGHYEMLATTITTLRIQPDERRRG